MSAMSAMSAAMPVAAVPAIASASAIVQAIRRKPIIVRADVQPMDVQDVLVNRGTGAGGANTNKSGKTFEQKTENESRLLAAGFVKKPIVEKNKAKFNYFLERIISPIIRRLPDTGSSQALFQVRLLRRDASLP